MEFSNTDIMEFNANVDYEFMFRVTRRQVKKYIARYPYRGLGLFVKRYITGAYASIDEYQLSSCLRKRYNTEMGALMLGGESAVLFNRILNIIHMELQYNGLCENVYRYVVSYTFPYFIKRNSVSP